MLVIERSVSLAKPGCVNELEQLAMTVCARFVPHPCRVYRTHTDVGDILISEIEFESWEQREKLRNEWPASPKLKELMKKVAGLVAAGPTSELLRLR